MGEYRPETWDEMNDEQDFTPPTSASNDVTVPLTGLGVRVEQGSLTTWRSASFAGAWFDDALREAIHLERDSRRREIVFSTACAESYMLEWVRDEVLQDDFRALDKYFPPDCRRSICEKWKQIPKDLKSDGRIRDVPDPGGKTWGAFVRLVRFRNGLVHAQASRPETEGQIQSARPVPSMAELDGLEHGWAVNVVRDLISELNCAAGTTPPDWI